MGKTKMKRAAGFSLVEITLAMLVISVGLLTVFGLFGASLQTNAASLDDTVAATFADQVFNGMRARYGENTVPVAMGSGFWQGGNESINVQSGARGQHRFTYGDIDYYDLNYSITRRPLGAKAQEVVLRVWWGRDVPTAPATARTFYTRIYHFN